METLKTVSCNLCGGDQFEVLIEKTSSGRIVRCRNCGLVQANPRNEKKLIKSARDLSAEEKEISQAYYLGELKVKELNAKRRLELLERFFPGRGRLLEVGAYIGIFLNLAKNRGWEVWGAEPIEVAARFGRERFKLDLRTGTLEEIEFPKNFFDAVVLYETIEHLPDPLATLRKINQLLKPGGLVAIETPNIANFWFKILRRHWRQFIASHFYFFDPKTIRLALEKSGFEVLDLRSMAKVVSFNLLATEISDNYSRPLGQLLKIVFRFLNLGVKNISLNLGDVMIVHARKKIKI